MELDRKNKMDKTSKKPGMKKGPAQGEQPCRSVQPKGNKTPLQALLTQDWRERGGGGREQGGDLKNKTNKETKRQEKVCSMTNIIADTPHHQIGSR